MDDFNCVENPALDRFPKHSYRHEPGIFEINELKAEYQLEDAFRFFKPDNELYTFVSNRNSFSRIDRLYATSNVISDYCYTEAKGLTDIQHKLLITSFDLPPKRSLDLLFGK